MSFFASLKSRAKQVYNYNVSPAYRHHVASRIQAEGRRMTLDKLDRGERSLFARARGGTKRLYQQVRERRRDARGEGNPRYYASGLMKRRSCSRSRFSKVEYPFRSSAGSRRSNGSGRSSYVLNKARYLYRKSRRY